MGEGVRRRRRREDVGRRTREEKRGEVERGVEDAGQGENGMEANMEKTASGNRGGPVGFRN